MAQVVTGIRSILSQPAVYDLLQNLLGAQRSFKRIVDEYLRPVPGQRLLDVGCGTCAILDYVPPGVEYIGVDLSVAYIESARRRYGDRGKFLCADVSSLAPQAGSSIDVALAVGLLHHLEDSEVEGLLQTLSQLLRPGGRLVTIDPCFDDQQSALARFFISKDRGQNVRTGVGYKALAGNHFSAVALTVRHDMSRIPYTHAILEYTR